jgi:hypothetical protein
MSCLRCNARAGAVTNAPRAAKQLGCARVLTGIADERAALTHAGG